MDDNPNEIVNVELRWDIGGWLPMTYSRNITRRHLGNLLLQLDDMAADTGIAKETSC